MIVSELTKQINDLILKFDESNGCIITNISIMDQRFDTNNKLLSQDIGIEIKKIRERNIKF